MTEVWSVGVEVTLLQCGCWDERAGRAPRAAFGGKCGHQPWPLALGNSCTGPPEGNTDDLWWWGQWGLGQNLWGQFLTQRHHKPDDSQGLQAHHPRWPLCWALLLGHYSGAVTIFLHSLPLYSLQPTREIHILALLPGRWNQGYQVTKSIQQEWLCWVVSNPSPNSAADFTASLQRDHFYTWQHCLLVIKKVLKVTSQRRTLGFGGRLSPGKSLLQPLFWT